MEKRYFLSITYKGSKYHGWQKQKEVKTVQGELEAALTRLGLSIPIAGSSRTDKGVHALEQVAHIDLPESVNVSILHHRLNRLLLPSIYVRSLKLVSSSDHARFDALSRTYHYYIHTQPSPFLIDTSWYCPYSFDLNVMNEAASLLLGEHNCKSFCKGHADVPSHICDIASAGWEQKRTQLIFHITANRFVHGMVRAIVGTLFEVGRGRLTPSNFADIIAQRDRCAAKSAAPPQGLFLTKVNYPSRVYSPAT